MTSLCRHLSPPQEPNCDWLNSTGNCKLGHDCRRVRSHRRRNSTRHFESRRRRQCVLALSTLGLLIVEPVWNVALTAVFNIQKLRLSKLTFPNCSKYDLTSSIVVDALRPPTNIFFVFVTSCIHVHHKQYVMLLTLLGYVMQYRVAQNSKPRNVCHWTNIGRLSNSCHRHTKNEFVVR